MRTIDNPPNSFTMECTARGSCAASQYTFAYSGGMTTFLESIKAGAPYAFYGSTFTIDNTGRGTNLVVRSIECGSGLCSGATFRLLNAMNIKAVELDVWWKCLLMHQCHAIRC